jgi:hypothetical protein
MDMIGLNRQFQHVPALLSTLLLDEGLAVFGDTPPKYGFTALGTPDQVVDDKVDAVFISLIIHVDIGAYNNTLINKNGSFEGRLKPEKAPNCYRLNGVACGGLKSVSVTRLRVGVMRLTSCHKPGEERMYAQPIPASHRAQDCSAVIDTLHWGHA